MTTYGLVAAGFIAEPLAQIQADLQAAFQAQYGSDIDLSSSGPFGQLIGIWADREATLWQLGQAVYGAAYPDTATGQQLADVCAITGVVPLPATKSTVTVCALGTNGTIIPIATLFATTPGAMQFSTKAASTIATLAAYGAGVAYVVGTLVSNVGNVYSCTAAIGTSATAPTGTGLAQADGGGTWRYCGVGVAAVAIPCAATLTGTLAAPAGTVTVVSTPVAGLGSVVNALDAVIGSTLETDAALRVRRAGLLHAQGNAALSSVRSAALMVAGVTAALVYENPADVIASSRPPHSFEAVVQGGADLAVATALFASKAAGIATYGTYTPQNVTDAQGVVHSILFTRPTAVPIYVAVAIKKGPGYAGDPAVQAAIIAYANGQQAEPLVALAQPYQIGQTVYASPLAAAILDQVAGVADVTTLFIGLAASPGTATPLAMAYNQLPSMQTAQISVVST